MCVKPLETYNKHVRLYGSPTIRLFCERIIEAVTYLAVGERKPEKR